MTEAAEKACLGVTFWCIPIAATVLAAPNCSFRVGLPSPALVLLFGRILVAGAFSWFLPTGLSLGIPPAKRPPRPDSALVPPADVSTLGLDPAAAEFVDISGWDLSLVVVFFRRLPF